MVENPPMALHYRISSIITSNFNQKSQIEMRKCKLKSILVLLLQLRFMDELIWWFQEPKIFKCRLTFEMRKILVSTNDFQIPISNDIKNVV